MKIVIELELAIPAGSTVEEIKARWTNNKVTSRVASEIEACAVGQVTSVSTKEVMEVVKETKDSVEIKRVEKEVK